MARCDGPPVEYLRQCSNTSLRYFEMSKLEHVANLRRELTVLMEEMMEESALALFARWIIERRSGDAAASGNELGGKSAAARRARKLLAELLGISAVSPSPEAPGRQLLEEFQGQARSDEDAEESPSHPGAIPRAKPHGSPQRGGSRAERRKARRPSRPAVADRPETGPGGGST